MTAAELGVGPDASMPDDRRVTSSNWLDPPFNRWGFQHVADLVTTTAIERGNGPSHELPADPQDLGEITFSINGERTTVDAAIGATYTDGVIVIHDGAVVMERYTNGMTASTKHLLMSVSKSLTATLCGVLVGEGLFGTEDRVVALIPELRGTSWEDCTVQHLLDMRAGTRFDESDYDDPDSDGRLIEEASGYRPRTREDLPADTCSWIAEMPADRAHGGAYEYRSILTDVLSWVMESVTGRRFVDLFSEKIWSQIGAEHDADVITDSAGFAAVEGGISTTLRDLARFGLMHMNDGLALGRRAVPEEWLARLRVSDQELIDTFADTYDPDPEWPGAFYHDQWWIYDAEREIYSAYGINGQQLLIHRPTRTVVAKFSTWPAGFVQDLSELQDAAMLTICSSLES